MKLQVFKRADLKKSTTKKIRREGQIPAVLYVRGQATEAIGIEATEFSSMLRTIKPGRLSTVVFNLSDGHGKERRAILKEVQYEPTTYNVHHLDFEELFNDAQISVKVPIECIGVADCVGVKAGGNLRQVLRAVRVRCLPKDIPTVFQFDVKNMGINETKRLEDLDIPNTVRPLANLREVAVVVAKRM